MPSSVPAAGHDDAGHDDAGHWICLDSYGTPYNKGASVVEFVPDAPGRIRFVGLARPTGRPTPANCTASRA
ncbi:hypothetical protein AB0903_13125 [Streptomyces sp. NPDC048389]|uniref:hypothetical protein n=1 Tax=Streptomyces sp. NPDC048389 TaxID=3154622 RepID=UPI003451463F